MPASLASLFTESECAVLAVIAGEVKHHGACDLPIDQVAALAGVCRTSVQNALHEARRLGLIKIVYRPQHGRKHLPNVVEIVSAEWRMWIKRGPTAHRPIGSKTLQHTSKILNPTKITKGRKPLHQGASSSQHHRPGGSVVGLRESDGLPLRENARMCASS